MLFVGVSYKRFGMGFVAIAHAYGLVIMLVILDAVKMSTEYHHKHQHKTIANAKDHSINIFVVKMHCILVATKY